MYIYPDNLKAKAMLFLWELKDIGIIGVSALISVFAVAQTGLLVPLAFTAVYAILSIQVEGVSILNFIRNAVAFFILKKQIFEWEES